MSMESFVEAQETTPGKKLRAISGSISGTNVFDEVIQLAEPINRTTYDARRTTPSGSAGAYLQQIGANNALLFTGSVSQSGTWTTNIGANQTIAVSGSTPFIGTTLVGVQLSGSPAVRTSVVFSSDPGLVVRQGGSPWSVSSNAFNVGGTGVGTFAVTFNNTGSPGIETTNQVITGSVDKVIGVYLTGPDANTGIMSVLDTTNLNGSNVLASDGTLIPVGILGVKPYFSNGVTPWASFNGDANGNLLIAGTVVNTPKSGKVLITTGSHITTNTIIQVTASTNYLASLAISVDTAGTTSKVNVSGSITGSNPGNGIIINGLSTSALSSAPTTIAFNAPIIMDSLYISQTGAVAGTIDVWLSYYQ